jgi:hypothetical protein
MLIINPGLHYVRLSECPYLALDSAQEDYEDRTVTPASHILLTIHFSAAGFMRYATKSAGHAYAHAPVLHKMTCCFDIVDCKVWNFQGQLPLRLETSPGVLLVFSEWSDIPQTGFLGVMD